MESVPILKKYNGYCEVFIVEAGEGGRHLSVRSGESQTIHFLAATLL